MDRIINGAEIPLTHPKCQLDLLTCQHRLIVQHLAQAAHIAHPLRQPLIYSAALADLIFQLARFLVPVGFPRRMRGFFILIKNMKQFWRRFVKKYRKKNKECYLYNCR